MARRFRPGTDGPAGLLAAGSSWLDDRPRFDLSRVEGGADAELEDAVRQLWAVSAAIRGRRGVRGMSQFQLAMLSGVRRQTVADIESGGSWPDALTLARVCAALGVRLTIAPAAD